ncbi:HAMP domain-containing sensor histidine kinase [Asticcacaulis sp. ZE23SCel15]|uniref:HAMP domain-containing sensor histidine kinase n=1 Tax=Asticcacaulis sp. ZE23SCel15 TaxID=3059027 RepID=UPI002660513A|nr:HAMP domain-containing sensor histidine kinase [Asticcacaulis sp. ZE23SCel15]WKL55835.1 HAMP domain-containing sensor histidine kinase [Asticcacaulis sp. ZE23SCel15]
MSDPKAEPPKTSRFFPDLPIFWQVLGMALAVLVLSLAINTLIVLKAPSPPPQGYTLTEAAQALKTGQVKLRTGRTLRMETVAETPDFVARQLADPDRSHPFETFLRERLAKVLGVPEANIYVDGRLKSRNGFGGPGPQRWMAPGPEGPQHRAPEGGPKFARPDGPPRNMGSDGPRDNLRMIGPDFRASELPESLNTQVTFPAFRAAWKQTDDTWRVLIPPRPLIEPWQKNLLIGFLLTALAVTPLAFFMSRRLTRPIRALAEGARTLGFDADAAPLKARGPKEVRAATEVLNDMQVRLKKQVESRTALIAAIAHDLKTPLARLRLRIETLQEPARDKINQDIAHMDSLINSALGFASAEKMAQTLTRLDLSSLIEIVCEDNADIHDVTCGDIAENITVLGNDMAIRRIVTNLIENACRYGDGCEVILRARENIAEVVIRDHGPGMPTEALEAVFEPFYRLETSRNRDTGGAGLGLSVAQSLSLSMHGSLRLENRYEGGILSGLDAIFTLPRL